MAEPTTTITQPPSTSTTATTTTTSTTASYVQKRKASNASSKTSNEGTSRQPLKKRIRSRTFSDNLDHFSTIAGSGSHSLLLLAPPASPATSRKASLDDEELLLAHHPLGSLPEPVVPPRKESETSNKSKAEESLSFSLSALDHLDALAANPSIIKASPASVAAASSLLHTKSGNHQQHQPTNPEKNPRKDSDASSDTFASSGHRLLMEAIQVQEQRQQQQQQQQQQQPVHHHALQSKISRDRIDSIANNTNANSGSWRRDRFESWGGMSDLSPNFLLHHPITLPSVMLEDVGAAVPSKISLLPNRTRIDSIASLGDASVGNMFLEDHNSADIQAFVAAAVASVGDQLAELAEEVELIAKAAVTGGSSSNASLDGVPLWNDLSVASSSAASPKITEQQNRPRAFSTTSSIQSSSNIRVDYDAVQAAVDAAEAAANDWNAQKMPAPKKKSAKKQPSSSSSTRRRQLPLRKHRSESGEEESHEIRHAGPIKKRTQRDSLPPDTAHSSSMNTFPTPKVSNRSSAQSRKDATVPPLPEVVHSTTSTANPKHVKQQQQQQQIGPANQKWESMFDALLEFAESRKAEETKNMSAAEIASWTWDGNVPTNHKTKDGKALGRWVNNQRSARAKGTLKADREQRLVDAGLKWSVMVSNAWEEMLSELERYVSEQAQAGKKWDGNVPTNYQIKSRPDGKFNGEDKNLGRWVNRQRSLYQAGRLRKDRIQRLEKMGLKWSVLATASWDTMFASLCIYVQEQINSHGSWDGNVPANFRTNDHPPRALGRWINRQRSAHAKKKLKDVYADKLTQLGLKWTVHQKPGESDDGMGADGFDDDEEDDGMDMEVDNKDNDVQKVDSNESINKANDDKDPEAQMASV